VILVARETGRQANEGDRFYSYWMNDGVTSLGDDLANERYPKVKAQTMEEWVKMQG